MAENSTKAQDTNGVEGTKNEPTVFTKEAQDLMSDIKNVVEPKPVVAEEPKRLIDEVVPKVEEEIVGEINIGEDIKDTTKSKAKISFKSADFFKQQIKKKTAQSALDDDTIGTPKTAPKKLTEEKLKDEIKEQLSSETKTDLTTGKALDKEEADMIAEFLIDGIDWGGSALLMYVAKDNTDTPYLLHKAKTDKLKKQLSFILLKTNKKMSIGALFGLTLALAYIKPVKQAIATRKAVKEGEKEVQRKKAEKLRKEREKEIEKKRILDNQIELKEKVAIADEPKEAVVIKEEEPKVEPDENKQGTIEEYIKHITEQPNLTEKDLDAFVTYVDEANASTPEWIDAVAKRRALIKDPPTFIDVRTPKEEQPKEEQPKAEIKEEERKVEEKKEEDPTPATKVDDKTKQVVPKRKRGSSRQRIVKDKQVA